VIGGGLAGMAVALRLRARGLAVTLVERNGQLGGRAEAFSVDGFRHDAGPSATTAAALLGELFALHGREPRHYLSFAPLDPWHRFLLADGSSFDVTQTVEGTLASIRYADPDGAGDYLRLMDAARRLHERGFQPLTDHASGGIGTLMAEGAALARLRCDRSLWALLCSHVKSSKLRDGLALQALIAGADPLDASSLMAYLWWQERKHGVEAAMGGTGQVVAALERLMGEVGITVRRATTVTRIETAGRRVAGVLTAGGEHVAADLVVAAVDPLHLYRCLLPERLIAGTARLKRQTPAGAARAILHLGVGRRYDDVAHSTYVVGGPMTTLLEEIGRRGVLPGEPSLLLVRPTAVDPRFAPEGADALTAIAPVPSLEARIDWQSEGPRLKDRLITLLERRLLPGLRRHIVSEVWLTPLEAERRYLSFAGAAHSALPSRLGIGALRFGYRSEVADGLFMVGPGTPLGPGLAAALTSAAVVERLVAGGGTR
jgi:phytoene desaturase